MFELVKAHSFDNATLETEFRLVSRHHTRAEAESARDEVVRSEHTEQWPHRPDMLDVIADYYSIRETKD
jgi:hypothetical protein